MNDEAHFYATEHLARAIGDDPEPRQQVLVLAGQVASATRLSVLQVLAAMDALVAAGQDMADASERLESMGVAVRAPLAETAQQLRLARPRGENPYANPARLARRERRNQRPGR